MHDRSTLAEYFNSQARWRDLKGEEYPEDKRNNQSARALSSLAEYVESGEADSEVDALLPHMGEGFSLGGEETARAVVRYGFGYEATRPLQHQEFLEELAVLCLEDAYRWVEFDGEGDDPTGTLYPHEIDAAKADVFIGSSYWRNRPNRTEEELAAHVAAITTEPEETR